MPSHPLCKVCTGMTEKWGMYSLVTKPPPFFVLWFVFSIIHRSGRVVFRFHVLYWTQTKEQKKQGRPGNKAGDCISCKKCSQVAAFIHMSCASGVNPATHKNSSKSMMQIWWSQPHGQFLHFMCMCKSAWFSLRLLLIIPGRKGLTPSMLSTGGPVVPISGKRGR